MQLLTRILATLAAIGGLIGLEQTFERVAERLKNITKSLEQVNDTLKEKEKEV
jgi:hypothetical protein